MFFFRQQATVSSGLVPLALARGLGPPALRREAPLRDRPRGLYQFTVRRHPAFSSFKGWARGAYHGPRGRLLRSYLDEFVFRTGRTKPITYNILVRLEVSA